MADVYKKLRQPLFQGGAKWAVFLDRDGVLIEDSGYLSDPAQIRWIDGSLEAVARINRAGVPVVVVTNQSGVGRGLYTWQDFEAVQESLEQHLTEVGGWLDGVWACGFHEDGDGSYGVASHPYRKPNSGMLEDAARELNLDLAGSWIVGDRAGDLQAGLSAGLSGIIHVLTGVGLSAQDEVKEIADRVRETVQVKQCRDLAEAVQYIPLPVALKKRTGR